MNNKYLVYHERENGIRGTLTAKRTVDKNFDIKNVISIRQGQDIKSSLVQLNDGRDICVEGNPELVVPYLCDKIIPENELNYDPNKMRIFRVDNRILLQENFPWRIEEKYMIEPKLETESDKEYKNRVYEQFSNIGVVYIKNS